jgi:hypothetical protein
MDTPDIPLTLPETTASIRWPGGSVAIYRKNNKPALGRWAIAWMTSHDEHPRRYPIDLGRWPPQTQH